MSCALGIAWMDARCRNGRRTLVRRGRRSVWPLGPRGPRTGRVSGMTNQRRVSALVLAALLVSSMVACSSATSGTTSTPRSQPTTSPTASASTTSDPVSEVELAEQAVGEVVRDYFSTLDRLRQDSARPLSDLKTVATSNHLKAQELLIRRERERELHQVGSTHVVELRVETIDLNNSDPEAGRLPTAWVDVCWDVSDADLLDQRGKSVVSSSRSDTGWTRYTVANYRWAVDPTGSWRITSGQDLEREPCAPA